jgi:hypothetical protein
MAIYLAVLLAVGGNSGAVEKYAIAADAKCVVVGRLVNAQQTPIAGGWDITGQVFVEDVLFGKVERGSRIPYRFRCSCCVKSPAPDLDSTVKNTGIWFLLPAPQSTWTSAGSCSDPGWRPVQERRSFSEFLKHRQEQKP